MIFTHYIHELKYHRMFYNYIQLSLIKTVEKHACDSKSEQISWKSQQNLSINYDFLESPMKEKEETRSCF